MRHHDIPPGALRPRAPMRGRYLIRSRKSVILIATIDLLLRLLPKAAPEPLTPPYDRILLANWGHIGDVLLTLFAVADLRRAYPDAKIGMLTGSWGKAAALGSGLVDTVHVVDHWALNRARDSKTTKLQRFLSTRSTAMEEIKSAQYQIGIDFYPFFPPAHPTFWSCGIPIRIGYESGGLGPFLTHPRTWHDSDRSVTDYCRDILKDLLPSRLAPGRIGWSYPKEPPTGAASSSLPRNYIVVHPGAGAPFKDWGPENWQALVLALHAAGSTVVITGSGPQETKFAHDLASLAEDVVDLSGKTTWRDFVGVIADASALICPDSAAAHLAAFFRIPTVAIFTGTNNPKQWAPRNPRARVLLKATACAPCYRPGCRAMACIRGITVAEVLDTLRTLQERPPADIQTASHP